MYEAPTEDLSLRDIRILQDQREIKKILKPSQCHFSSIQQVLLIIYLQNHDTYDPYVSTHGDMTNGFQGIPLESKSGEYTAKGPLQDPESSQPE